MVRSLGVCLGGLQRPASQDGRTSRRVSKLDAFGRVFCRRCPSNRRLLLRHRRKSSEWFAVTDFDTLQGRWVGVEHGDAIPKGPSGRNHRQWRFSCRVYEGSSRLEDALEPDVLGSAGRPPKLGNHQRRVRVLPASRRSAQRLLSEATEFLQRPSPLNSNSPSMATNTTALPKVGFD